MPSNKRLFPTRLFRQIRQQGKPLLFSVVSLGLSLCGIANAVTPTDPKINFNRDIRPILADKCYYCHGPDVENNKADLRLDIREIAIRSEAIVPGDAFASHLVERIQATDPDDIMPPPEAHKPLTDAEKETLIRWIDAGAQYDIHWSYKRVEETSKQSIDEILRAGLKKQQLNLSNEAPKTTLVRRAYLDAIGLPPTPEQAERYLTDQSTQAYEALIDELLASPHFGENFAIDWLDAVRFTDSLGYHGDQPRDASPFRDYVIHAFNSNMPYDQFVTEQVAGDLLPNATIKQRVASGFNRLNQISQEVGIQDQEYIKKYQSERIRTSTTALLGSTLACAECHDHKFDPFTAKDFYSFGAFFADILEKGAWNHHGKYQETDIRKYLEEEHIFEKGKLGPTMRVPNKTFLVNPENYQAELKRRLELLLQGTPNAAKEFKKWLTEKQTADEANIPADYYLNELTNEQSATFADDRLPIENGYRYQFEVFPHRLEEGERTGFALLFTFEDAEYLFHWGQGIAEKKKGRTLIGKGPVPDEAVWTSLYIYPHEFRKHKTANPVSIGFLSNKTKLLPHAVDVRNARLKTSRQKVPVGDLNERGAALLEAHLKGEADASQMTELRTIYFAEHANSPDQIALRLSYQSIYDYLNGTRDTPITISAKAREIKILPRGNWMDETGEVVQPATPAFLDFTIASSPEQRLTRLDLAEWIVHRDNPLTARTYVNRIWGHFFGTPLSNAPEDLGLQGEYPVYPELLEYLAYEFMESGWNVKHIVKTILMSEVYRQSSRSTPALDELDPYNRLLARQSPRRLKAENIRDNALVISNLLVPRIGGASTRPYQPEGYYQHLNFPRRRYKSDAGENQYRRGLYTHWQRTFLHPMLSAFDAPSRDECAVARPRSNTPLQALNQLNDPSFVEAAIALAQDLVVDHPGDDATRVAYAYSRVLARAPSEAEKSTLLQFLNRERERFTTTPDAAKKLIATGHFKTDASLSAQELAAWTSLTRALLNLHETITRY